MQDLTPAARMAQAIAIAGCIRTVSLLRVLRGGTSRAEGACAARPRTPRGARRASGVGTGDIVGGTILTELPDKVSCGREGPRP